MDEQGVWEVSVWSPKDYRRLWLLAMATENEDVLRMAELLKVVLDRADTQSIDCFCCGAKIPKGVAPGAVSMVKPAQANITGDMQTAVGGLVCKPCARSGRRVVLQQVIAVWREMIDPTARMVEVHSGVGHA